MDSFNSKPKEESIIPIDESFNLNQSPEDIFESSLHSSSNKKVKNMKNKNEVNYFNNDIDVDPNFRDIKLKKEEEARRRKEVEEFEKRKLKKYKDNNIIDYDESSEKKNKKNKDDIQIDDEGIYIDNFNYISKTKINNISYKNSLGKKNINNNNNLNNNEIEDYESKITQIKHLSSYSKDDLNINISPDKLKKENIKFKIINLSNNNQNKVDIIKESETPNTDDINPYNNLDINESNYEMNFYDTVRKSINENSKKFPGVFESLVPNKSFQKFLKEKIKYYMDEKDIPKNFINNLYSGIEIKEKPYLNRFNNYNQNLKSLDSGKINFNIYSNENMSNTNIYKNKNRNFNKSY